MQKATILVIEDDADIRELLRFQLGREGWTVLACERGEEGLKILAGGNIDCVLLDIMLPGMDGLATLKAIKADPANAALPVVMTTAKGEDGDIVAGLELGADDYVVKPFSAAVLVARVKAALRRREASARVSGDTSGHEEIIAHAGLSISPERHEALYLGKKLDLSATEFAILAHLARSPGRVFSRSRIIDAVKGPDYPVTDRSVDVQILSLRKKMGSGGGLIETVRGIGYRMKDE